MRIADGRIVRRTVVLCKLLPTFLRGAFVAQIAQLCLRIAIRRTQRRLRSAQRRATAHVDLRRPTGGIGRNAALLPIRDANHRGELPAGRSPRCSSIVRGIFDLGLIRRANVTVRATFCGCLGPRKCARLRLVVPEQSLQSQRVVHRQRFRLKLGASELLVESKTSMPLEATPDDVARLSPSVRSHVHAWGPLLLHMGYKGFGRALSQISSHGFVQSVSRHRLAGLRVGHHALVAAGFIIEAWQMARAIHRSVSLRSARPATAQAARSLTTWGAVWAGVELFGTGGALLGIELGPAVVVTTAIGATIGGCVGFFAGDWVARQIETGAEAELDSGPL